MLPSSIYIIPEYSSTSESMIEHILLIDSCDLDKDMFHQYFLVTDKYHQE